MRQWNILFIDLLAIVNTILGHEQTYWHSNHNGNQLKRENLKLGNINVELPPFNERKLPEELKTAISKARRFAQKYNVLYSNLNQPKQGKSMIFPKRTHSKYDERKLQRNYQKFNANFDKDYKKLNKEIQHLKFASYRRNSGSNGIYGSLMGKLSEFMNLLGNLPAKMTCLIYNCQAGQVGWSQPLLPVPTPQRPMPDADQEENEYPPEGDEK